MKTKEVMRGGCGIGALILLGALFLAWLLSGAAQGNDPVFGPCLRVVGSGPNRLELYEDCCHNLVVVRTPQGGLQAVKPGRRIQKCR